MIRTSKWLNVVAIAVLSAGLVAADEKPVKRPEAGSGRTSTAAGLMDSVGSLSSRSRL